MYELTETFLELLFCGIQLVDNTEALTMTININQKEVIKI